MSSLFPIKRKVVRAYIYNANQEKVLIIKSYISFFFSLPGGGVKLTETGESALIRELNEELGIQAEDIKSITFLKNVSSKKRFFLFPLESSVSLFTVLLKHDVTFTYNWEVRKHSWVAKKDSFAMLKKYMQQPF